MWKAEQRRKKESQKKESQKKPPFIVGMVHHDICPPLLMTNVSAAPKERKKVVQAQKNSNKKGITKVTEKRLLAKATKTKIPETSGKKKEISSNDAVKSDINRRESFAPPNHKFNPPTGLPKVQLFGETGLLNENTSILNELTEAAIQEHSDTESIEAITLQVSAEEEISDFQTKQTNSTIKSILNDNNITTPLIKFSLDTFTTVEKVNSSKSLISFTKCSNYTKHYIKRNKQNNSDLCFQASSSSNLTDKLATKDTAIENPDGAADKITVEYFKHALIEETNRLQKLCEEWTEIQSQDDITEDIRYHVNQAVGQTSMLIKNKFRQFHGLILDCEKNDDAVLITCTDLHGFWDMMYIEIKDCDSRFAKLEKLRARRWQEDQSSSTISTRSKEKIGTKKKVIPTRKSSRRTLIFSNKKTEIIEIQDNKKNLQEINLDNDKYSTPYVNKRTFVSNNKRSLEMSRNIKENVYQGIRYTSTPFFNGATSISSKFSTPLIAMKVSKLYNGSLLLNDTMELIDTSQCIIPDQTPRKNSMEKSEKPKSKSLRMQLICKANLNDLMTESFERLEIDQNSGVSSKKINEENQSGKLDSDKRISTEENSKSDSGDSVQTVIEGTNNETLMLSEPSLNSTKTPEESERSVKKFSSNKSSNIGSFKKCLRRSIVNKIVESPLEISMINTTSISRNASLIHDNRKISFKITPKSTGRLKKYDSNVKENKAITPED